MFFYYKGTQISTNLGTTSALVDLYSYLSSIVYTIRVVKNMIPTKRLI